jgi:homoserine O-succinyltransferase/O-acetyltransferase
MSVPFDRWNRDLGESIVPLIINDGHIPHHWAEHQSSRPATSTTATVSESSASNGCLRIALINNMPDAALEDTESQFFSLLEAAAGCLPVLVSLYYLPDVPRGDRVQDHLAKFYRPADELWRQRFDGAIITGTEPRQRNLLDEPYWNTLAAVFDWAEQHTASTVLSCLAAHASVLHSDGIDRHPLPDKQFGVFDYKRIGKHKLTVGLPRVIRFPHSRWNEVRRDELVSNGYDVLDQSATAGVNLFVKKKGNSLFVHFQGHPEYGPRTLLKEYRRDIRRFLRQERLTYPSLPHGYFDTSATNLLADFRARAEAKPAEETLSTFPESGVADTLKNSWQAFAHALYRNWLQFMIAQQASASPNPSLIPTVRA